MSTTVTGMSPTVQRVLGIAVLLGAGVYSLPASAALLDGEGTENWIVPAQLLAMIAVGAALTVALPAMARTGATTGRRAMTGAWWGLLAAFAGVLLSWLLLNGLSGA